MKTRFDTAELRRLYEAGENIMGHFRDKARQATNSEEAILYSYDLQAGSYTKALENPEFAAKKDTAARKLARILDELGPSSLLEAGTGEATTLAAVLGHMIAAPKSTAAFDISLSRLLYARRLLAGRGLAEASLFTATLENVPLHDASVDLTFTHHALEPNAGREREILEELLRVTRRYLVLIEPSWELGGEETRARIEAHSYVRGLPEHLENLGARIVSFEKWGCDINPLNEAALIVVDKSPGVEIERRDPGFISPISRQPLQRYEDCWHCASDGFAFPIIGGVSCLLPENAVLAARLPEALL